MMADHDRVLFREPVWELAANTAELPMKFIAKLVELIFIDSHELDGKKLLFRVHSRSLDEA